MSCPGLAECGVKKKLPPSCFPGRAAHNEGMDEVTLQQRFIDNVNRLIDENGFTRAQLAEKMSCADSYINGYLGSKKGGLPKYSPGLDVVARFAFGLNCLGLGIDPSDLLVEPSHFAVPA